MDMCTPLMVHGDHGHGEPHESPMVMLVPLMVLALLSLVGGLVGIHNGFEHFLEPVFGPEFPRHVTEGIGQHRTAADGCLGSVLFRGSDSRLCPVS